MRKSLASLAAIVAFGLWAVSAQATPVLDFNMDGAHPTTTTLSYAGGIAPLIGTNISVDSVVGFDTPANDGVMLAITSGRLDFTTGAGLGGWNFGSGGLITVTGGVPGAGVAAGTELLKGTFQNAAIHMTTPGVIEVVVASFFDTKNETLAGYYGLGGVKQWEGAINLGFQIKFPLGVKVGDAFERTRILSGDIVNQPVPEPGTMVLVGSGLLGLLGVSRRRKV